ncbi:MAG: efflux RND transporter periplasmic adaptor subunit [Myxococcales bacterium]|nr:efflux RND transporter periplasmic adaptor subunit [Myxococcales bacterium]
MSGPLQSLVDALRRPTGRATARATCAAVAIVALGAACKGRDPPAAPAKAAAKEPGVDVSLSPVALEAAGIVVAPVVTQPRRSSVTLVGVVDFSPSRVARVGPNISGRVGSVNVAPGQVVARGAVVATLVGVEVGRARADWASAKARLDLASLEVEREQKMNDAGASSDRSLQTARNEKRQAEAELRAAEGRLSTLGVRGAEGPVSSTVPLVTPLAGTVLEVHARVGQPVGATDTLVVVGETTEVWLSVDVYERDLAKVHERDEARVSAIAYPDATFAGKVDHVDTTVDPERRVLRARIVLPNADGRLKPGMSAVARVLGAPETTDGGALAVVTVPRGAVQTIDGAPFVFVEKAKGKFELRAIERGQDLEGAVEVLRGLVAGEPVVSSGSFILKSEVLREQMGSND